MSGRLVGEVLDYAPADLTPAETLVLVALAEAAKDRDRTARFQCSVDVLATRTRLSSGTVRNALSHLTRRGLIRPLIKGVSRGGRHQEYELARLETRHRFATHRDETRP